MLVCAFVVTGPVLMLLPPPHAVRDNVNEATAMFDNAGLTHVCCAHDLPAPRRTLKRPPVPMPAHCGDETYRHRHSLRYGALVMSIVAFDACSRVRLW